MQTLNLPTDLLRTFITVIDLGGYTKAANALGRTQPAISLQMSRLQEMVESKLLVQRGRSLELTENGAALAAFARQMLHLNDEAVARFRPPKKRGVLRIGLPTDFAVSKLQSTVTQFVDLNPEVLLNLTCDLSQLLFEALHRGDLDLIVGLIGDKNQQFLVRTWEDQPIWAISKSKTIGDDEVVPIVCHPEGCEYRNRMTEALGEIGRDWRVVYTSPDVSGLQYAVDAGLGVSALTHATLGENMRILDELDGFPKLAKIRIGLCYKLPSMTAAGMELSNQLLRCLEENTDQHFTSSVHPATQ